MKTTLSPWYCKMDQSVKDYVGFMLSNLEEIESKLTAPEDIMTKIAVGFARRYILEVAEKNGYKEGKVMNVKVKKLPNFKGELEYGSVGAAGFDLTAGVDKAVVVEPGERKLIPTGIAMAVPFGYELQIRPRSGLALKYGITVLNTPGTIDADYRGEIGVVLFNSSKEGYIVGPGDRIAQGVLNKFEHVEFDFVDILDETDRGSGGFGSTGVN